MSTALDTPIQTTDEVGTTTIAGGDTQIALDPEFYQTLADLGIEINTAGIAMLGDEDDSLNLPITGGEITDESIKEWMGMAELEHSGSGLSLSRNGVTVELDDWTLNTGTGDIHGSTLIRGMDNPRDISELEPVLFTLAETADLSAGLNTDSTDEVLILDEADILLTAEAARLLNTAFSLDEGLNGDSLVGTATVRISTG